MGMYMCVCILLLLHIILYSTKFLIIMNIVWYYLHSYWLESLLVTTPNMVMFGYIFAQKGASQFQRLSVSS